MRELLVLLVNLKLHYSHQIFHNFFLYNYFENHTLRDRVERVWRFQGFPFSYFIKFHPRFLHPKRKYPRCYHPFHRLSHTIRHSLSLAHINCLGYVLLNTVYFNKTVWFTRYAGSNLLFVNTINCKYYERNAISLTVHLLHNLITITVIWYTSIKNTVDKHIIIRYRLLCSTWHCY